MNAPDDYCELCDLPLSQCVHGQPPPPPPAPRKAASPAPRPRSRPSTTRTPATPATPAPTKHVTRRWTPPEVFKPLILDVLEQAGGELDNDDLFDALEGVVQDRLLVGDRENTPEGEPRWRYAARRARVALIAEGLMVKGTPGVWQLA